MKTPALFAVLAAMASSAAPAVALGSANNALNVGERPMGKPATSLKIEESTAVNTPGESDWFVRGDLGIDVPVKGAAGFGVSVDHMGDYVFFGGNFRYYQLRYGAVRVYQPGIGSGFALDPATEIGRSRSDSDTASLWAVGPEIGFMFKFLGSDRWVESGRFSLGYAQYQDTTNNLSMRGALAEFHAEMGYKVNDTLMVAPGMNYNVGFTRRTGSAYNTGQPSTTYFPIQWWSWQFSVYLWL